MRILNKDVTEEERDDVLATIKKASVDVTDVLSELAAIIPALALIYFFGQKDLCRIVISNNHRHTVFCGCFSIQTRH
jgi:hypothetical protein